MAALDEITIKGFKSIKDLTGFKPAKLNILVGANGAGKSNLVDFFRMLRAMADGRLQKFVTDGGGPDGYFFNGPKETKSIFAHLKFGYNEFQFYVEPTVAGEMRIYNESKLYTGGKDQDWKYWGSGRDR